LREPVPAEGKKTSPGAPGTVGAGNISPDGRQDAEDKIFVIMH
jgi:hypothetical protein